MLSQLHQHSWLAEAEEAVGLGACMLTFLLAAQDWLTEAEEAVGPGACMLTFLLAAQD